MVRRHRGANHEVHFGGADACTFKASNCGFIGQVAGGLVIRCLSPLKNAGSLKDPIAIAAKGSKIFVGDNLIWNVGASRNDCKIWAATYATPPAVAKGVFWRNGWVNRRQDLRSRESEGKRRFYSRCSPKMRFQKSR